MTEQRKNPLQPPPSLLAKVGSIVTHLDEADGTDSHPFDWVALRGLLADPEVIEWVAAMRAIAMVSVPRRRVGK